MLATVVQHTTADREDNPWQVVYPQELAQGGGLPRAARRLRLALARLERRLGMLHGGGIQSGEGAAPGAA